MSGAIGGAGGSGAPITTFDDNFQVTTTAKVVDNVWTDDSISKLFSTDKPGSSYNQYAGFPSIPKPDNQLANSFDIRTQLKDFATRDQPPLDLTVKNPNETTLNKAYDGFFEKTIAGKPNADELRFAHYNAAPGTPPTTPEELEAFKLLVSQFPEMQLDGFVPKPDKEFFKNEANLANGDEFSNLLDNQIPPLTADQKAILKFKHFHPDAKFKGSDNPKLLAELKSLEGQAAAITAKNFGIPVNADGTLSMPLEADPSMYDAALNGYFDEYAAQATTAYVKDNSMSESDAKQLSDYVKDPTTAVSTEIKTAGDLIRSQAIAKVISENHLEAVGFVPAAPGTFAAIPPLAKGMIKEMEETFNVGTALVSKMQDGPQKTILLDILKQISSALSNFKSVLYGSQGATTAQAANYSKAKLELALEQIKKNVEAMHQQAKGPDCGDIVGRIFKFLIGLILLSMAAGMGPAGGPLMAVAVMMMVDACAPKLQVFQKVMNGIAMLVAKCMPYLQGDALKAFQDIAKMMFMLMAGPFALITAGPDLMTASGIIADIAMATGKSKEDAEAAQQMAMMIIGAVVTAVVMVVTLVVTLGTAFPALIPEFLGAAAEAMVEIGAQLASSIPKMAAIAMDVADLAMAGFTIVDSSFKINNAVIKKNLALLMGKLKAEQALTDAEIQMMVKMIKKLLASLEGSSEAISFVAGVQSHILSNESQAISGLTSVRG